MNLHQFLASPDPVDVRQYHFLASLCEDQRCLISLCEACDAKPSLPTVAGEHARTIAAIPCDLSREFALRCVTPIAMKVKAKDSMLAQEWRSYDKATFSYLEDGKLFWEDGHIRMTAFHAILYVFHLSRRPVPVCLGTMAGNVSVVIVQTKTTRKEAITRSIASSAALTHGIVPLSWFDIVVECTSQAEESYADDLASMVQAACPEYAKKITNWKHIRNLCTRLAGRTIRAVEECMSKAGLAFHLLPQTWLREAFILLPVPRDCDAPPPAKRGRPSTHAAHALSEEEQEWAVRWILAAAAKAAHEGNAPCDSVTMFSRLVE